MRECRVCNGKKTRNNRSIDSSWVTVEYGLGSNFTTCWWNNGKTASLLELQHYLDVLETLHLPILIHYYVTTVLLRIFWFPDYELVCSGVPYFCTNMTLYHAIAMYTENIVCKVSRGKQRNFPIQLVILNTIIILLGKRVLALN